MKSILFTLAAVGLTSIVSAQGKVPIDVAVKEAKNQTVKTQTQTAVKTTTVKTAPSTTQKAIVTKDVYYGDHKHNNGKHKGHYKNKGHHRGKGHYKGKGEGHEHHDD